MSEIKELVVAAIDFGTTYSGYAYSFRDEYKKDPLKIYSNVDWSDGTGMVTLKTPTVILFDKKGKFNSFGYKAEDKYADLANKDTHEGWKYFKRFKMELFKSKKIRLNMSVEDDQGKNMLALDVFSASIRFLKDHLLQNLQSRGRAVGLRETDIHWVLTVPAIWDDAAKQFMTEAALQADIPTSQLTLAYEPEAAAIYCKEVKIAKAKESGRDAELSSFKPGCRFMILDLGGGTVDITAHEVERDGTLKALCPPSGGPWGGTLVDRQLHVFLVQLFGKDVLDEFTTEYKPDKLDLDRIAELKKRQIKVTTTETDDEDMVHIKLPIGLYEIYDEKHPQQKFDATLKRGDFKQTVRKRRDRLNITNTIFVDMFEESKNNLVSEIQKLLRKPELRGVKTLMMVGGFSESEIIQNAVKDAFPAPGYHVIVPEQGGIAIMKGAVMYGHNTNSICSRKMPYSYGISTAIPFDSRNHPQSHRVISSDGTEKCEDVFKPFIKKGDTVVPNKTTTEHAFNSPSTGSKSVTVEVYKSENNDTKYTTEEGCKRVAELKLKLTSKAREEKALINVEMAFGGTKITVKAKEHGTRNHVQAEFNCLI